MDVNIESLLEKFELESLREGNRDAAIKYNDLIRCVKSKKIDVKEALNQLIQIVFE